MTEPDLPTWIPFGPTVPVLPRVGSSLRWDYDVGDSWEHDVVVEAIKAPGNGARYPLCPDGARACPPEDCGGTDGYAHLLAVLAANRRLRGR